MFGVIAVSVEFVETRESVGDDGLLYTADGKLVKVSERSKDAACCLMRRRPDGMTPASCSVMIGDMLQTVFSRSPEVLFMLSIP